MAILVTGATGTVGAPLLRHLSDQGVDIKALTRDPAKVSFPAGVVPVAGDLMDVPSMRAALTGVRTLFLLNAVVPQELTQSMLTLNLAHEAGIQRVVYLSVFNSDICINVPHFAAKHTIERMIEQYDMAATILRPNCFMQNDAAFFKDALMGPGLYPFPIGDRGVSMVDVGDIAEIAAGALLQRERSDERLPREVINLVGPEALTGASVAGIWSTLLNKPVHYTGDDTTAFEQRLAHHAPSWMAMDMRLMLDRFQSDGMLGTAHDVEQMTRLLGRPPRTYAEFAAATLAHWQR